MDTITAPVNQTVLIVVGMILAALAPVITQIVVYLKSKSERTGAATELKSYQQQAKVETVAGLDKIHTLVNATATAAIIKAAEQERIINQLEAERAAAVAGADHARAIAELKVLVEKMLASQQPPKQ